ncbi:protein lin-52-like protein isoform 1, partial [Daubentonia madagascariensis]
WRLPLTYQVLLNLQLPSKVQRDDTGEIPQHSRETQEV